MSILERIEHRLFPYPKEPWIMAQTWKHLLFAHYRVEKAVLRELVPKCFEIDTYDGQAWISIVPFEMSGIHLHGLRELPAAPVFEELNVRTYITFGGKPGVYFFSLDANSALAVKFANITYGLPYLHAKMRKIVKAETVEFFSERTDARAEKGIFSSEYRPISEEFTSTSGSIDYWLTERYLLYVVKGKGIYEGNIHHCPWALQEAEAKFEINTVAESVGIPIEEKPDILTYSKKLDVLVWRPKKVGIIG
ncbi:YqjF family protein [Bacillus suaedae]|uniref:DUF2071 domain-containing protein n=1 Tax=Halalkalibacter suaedae TaxID=2822140 RepID=A0A941AQW9_9BACI|nr:DUF2071 domain-containing protein [Bacillus suaedae]MBP3953276.1 DUF2071 domain-containing protein [Bacillus suaedae]